MAIPTPTTPIYDPDLPVYADPEIKNEQIQGASRPDEAYINPQQATVEGRTLGLLKSGNPLLERAQAMNSQEYNRRGLLNSSMAVQGGTAAVMDKALQIAQPDALLYSDMAKQRQAADQTLNLERNRARLSAALTTQEQQGQVEMQKMIDNAQMQRVEVDNQWKQMINFDNIDAEMQRSLMSVSSVFGESLTGGIERIMRDTNIKDKGSAIESLMTQYRTQMSTAASIAGITLTW